MTLEIGFLFVLLAVMVYLFLTELLPVDLTAFSGLVILVLMGYVAPLEAFSGFASPAVITMLSIFIVGAALLHTGLADMVGQRVHSWVGSREMPLTITIMLVAAALSAFMNNIAATAVLMPAVASLARRAQIPPSRLFMPLAFAAILGGTTTLVGTPPNILAAAMLEERGLKPFSLFDFTPLGLLLLAVGMLFMVTVGRRLLPTREVGALLEQSQNLAQVYQLHERLFSIRIPRRSRLDGLTLAEARLRSTLGVQVLAISRGNRRELAPDAGTRLRGGDVLLVEGKLTELQELLRVQTVQVRKAEAGEVPRPIKGVSGFRARLAPESPLIGKTLREIQFREKFGVVVVGIIRDETILRDLLGEQPLRRDDEILAVGPVDRLKRLRSHSDLVGCRVGLSAVQELESYLYLLSIPTGSPLAGGSIAETRFGELVGVTVAGIVRGGETRLAVAPQEVIREEDRLLVAGEPSKIIALLGLGEVSLESQIAEPDLESDDIGVLEVTVAPRSSLAGKTLRELSFRERYGLQVLGIWREGKLVRTRLARLPIRFGDGLLLHGDRPSLKRLASDPDFVVLSDVGVVQRRTRRAPFALGGLLVMIGFVVTGFQPIQVAAFTAATLVILSGAIKMEEAYRAIEWRAIFLVAAVLPVGMAMERTGAALLLAETVTSLAGPLGPYFVLASLVVLSSLLSQGLDGAPAVVLLAPVVTQTASQLGLSPYPVMMGVGLAASAAFMTPFSHKANLLVMGAGGYHAMDYAKVGAPLTIVLLILMVIFVPFFFPF